MVGVIVSHLVELLSIDAGEGLAAAGQLHGHLKLGGQAGDLAHDHLALLDLGLQGGGLLALAGQAHEAHLLLSEAILDGE